VITEKTVGHPYMVVFSMSELLMHSEGKEHIGLEELQAAWSNIEYSFGRMLFSQKFQIATDKERQLMIAIAKTKKEFVSPTDFKMFGKGVAELFSRLESKELLVKQERGKYSLFHPMFTEFLRHQQ
jgi:hypothetical protein